MYFKTRHMFSSLGVFFGRSHHHLSLRKGNGWQICCVLATGFTFMKPRAKVHCIDLCLEPQPYAVCHSSIHTTFPCGKRKQTKTEEKKYPAYLSAFDLLMIRSLFFLHCPRKSSACYLIMSLSFPVLKLHF